MHANVLQRPRSLVMHREDTNELYGAPFHFSQMTRLEKSGTGASATAGAAQLGGSPELFRAGLITEKSCSLLETLSTGGTTC
jgi:hypothetical protein